MKKAMLATLAAGVVGGVFAYPVFDYKASVKYVDFKTVSDKLQDGSVYGKVYVKVVKSATLNGYLVTPVDCPCEEEAVAADIADGQLPGFLVVKNKATAKVDDAYSTVKVLPANLLSSVWSQSVVTTKKTATLEAQGYLFAGFGDNVDAQQNPDPTAAPAYNFGDADTAGTKYLFGEFNCVDENMVFIEPFLYASGFGKATWTMKKGSQSLKPCRPTDIKPGDKSICLNSLAGSVIGGSFSCIPNGVYVAEDAAGDMVIKGAVGYVETYLCQSWNSAVNADYEYNVVTGTWSIKVNTKIVPSAANMQNAEGIVANNTIEELALVEACGQKLDRYFNLYSFDEERGAETKDGEFATKWF